MKLKHFLPIAAAVLCLSCSKQPSVKADYNVVPLPQSVAADTVADAFTLNSKTCIAVMSEDSAMMRNAQLLAEYIGNLTGFSPKIVKDKLPDNAICLETTLANSNPEAYEIDVTKKGIRINGTTAAGNFYGIQTIRKAIPAAGKHDVVFPAAHIADQPRFAYRGTHLDSGRHFFSADSVKTFIDILALHNVNRMHWHLSEDQGWRIEIKSHPRLMTVGSMRDETMVGRNFSKFDGVPHGGYYTQEQLRDIVRYAADRHITIIPEIDLPGHMQAALASYPHLGCTGGPYKVWTQWGVSDEVLCAGNDSVYQFIDAVLNEVADIFPSEYIHVGGDECPKVRWSACPKCQAKIKELGLKKDSHSTAEQKLQTHVMRHASNTLAKRGRKIIGWDEIMEGGLPEGAVVMSWRGVKGGIAAAGMGHDAIMTPCDFMYFDFYQTDDRSTEPLAASWGGPITVEKVYSYEPIPADFTAEQAGHILGVQANLWSEYIPNMRHMQYMALPRLAALSEVQWSKQPKDYKAFTVRMKRLVPHYDASGYNYAKHSLK